MKSISGAGFRISSTEAVASLLLLPLLAALRTSAPGVVVSVTGADAPRMREDLEAGDTDLVVGYFSKVSGGLYAKPLFKQQLAVIARRPHPAIRTGLGLDTYLSLPHVRFSRERSRPSTIEATIDAAFAKAGSERNIGARVHSLLYSPAIVARTDMLATLPLTVHAPPIPLAAVDIAMVWHERTHRSDAQRWFRERVVEALQMPIGVAAAGRARRDRSSGNATISGASS